MHWLGLFMIRKLRLNIMLGNSVRSQKYTKVPALVAARIQ